MKDNQSSAPAAPGAGRGAGWLAGAALALAPVPPAAAAPTPYAVEVVAYDPGDIRSDYRFPASALGKTDPFTATSPFQPTPFAVTPFNAPFGPAEIAGIGAGGRLVLRLGKTAATGRGFTLGVHAGVGLVNVGGAGGQADDPATTVNDRRADLRVSADGQTWVPLAGDVVFQVPTNYYSAGVTEPQAQTTPGTAEADFTKPFFVAAGGPRPARLSDFDGVTYAQMLALLDGSGGGTWFDLTDVPLPGVNYVEFTVDAADGQMYVDSVVVAPEPGALAVLALGAGMATGRRRRRAARVPR